MCDTKMNNYKETNWILRKLKYMPDFWRQFESFLQINVLNVYLIHI